MKKQRIGNEETNLVEKSVLEYLYGEREKALLDLSRNLQEFDLEDIKAILKQELFSYMKSNGGKEGRVEHYAPLYKMIKNFNANDFIKRTWKYVPYYIPEDEYKKIQATCKYHVRFKRYNYEKPLYDFANNVEFTDSRVKHEAIQEKTKNDIRFYVGDKSGQGQSVFAKVVSLKYKPVSLKLVREKMTEQPYVDEETLLSDRFLYTRSFSISMYALLNANPNEAMPIMRYDNDVAPHHNVFVGEDKRKVIFGDTAVSPHFHFQNEEDSLMCLRKFRSFEGPMKYRTGRCNAIDCPHLKAYLKKLDRLNKTDLHKNIKEKNDYGMPFLALKANNKVKTNVFKDPEDSIREYLSSHDSRGGYDIIKWLDRVKELKLYEQEHNRIFTNLIKSLDLLELIVTKEKACLDIRECKVLSDLEISLANDVMSEINYLIEKPLTGQEIDDNYYSEQENEV